MDTTIKVLVIDAQQVVRKVLGNILTDAGYKVWTAAGIQKAAQITKKVPFEVVITEITGAMEAVKFFNKIDPNIRVLVMSAQDSLSSVIDAIRQGAYNYVAQPFCPEEIQLVLGKVREELECLRENRERDIYKEPSITNVLTDAYNHLYLNEILMREITRAKWYKHPLSLICVNISSFDKFIDLNGRLAGDEVLRNMARLLDASTRKVDLLFRCGESGFALLCPETDKEGAGIVAKRIHSIVNKAEFIRQAGSRGHLAVSIGLAAYPLDARSTDRLIWKAQHG